MCFLPKVLFTAKFFIPDRIVRDRRFGASKVGDLPRQPQGIAAEESGKGAPEGRTRRVKRANSGHGLEF